MFHLYFAGNVDKSIDDFLAELKLARLYSQLNDRKCIDYWNEYETKGDLFIDSGAWTAHTKGTEVDIDEYIDYINSMDEKLHIYAELDKIPGVYKKPKSKEELLHAPEYSWKNYLYMRERVKSPEKLLPIFHQGEDYKWLSLMLETTFGRKHIPYIGISPANDSSLKYKKIFIENCFKVIHQSSNPNVKTHAFGMTSWDVLEAFPFYSADSTRWIWQSMLGNIMTPYGVYYVSRRGEEYNYNLYKMGTNAIKKFESYIRQYGFELEELKDDYNARMKLNAIHLKWWCETYTYKGAKVYKKKLF